MTARKSVLVDCCVVLFLGHGCSSLFIFLVVTSVELNTVQVTNMAQRHSFVFEDCHKSISNSIQDADPCSTDSLLTTVARLISIRSSKFFP